MSVTGCIIQLVLLYHGSDIMMFRVVRVGSLISTKFFALDTYCTQFKIAYKNSIMLIMNQNVSFGDIDIHDRPNRYGRTMLIDITGMVHHSIIQKAYDIEFIDLIRRIMVLPKLASHNTDAQLKKLL